MKPDENTRFVEITARQWREARSARALTACLLIAGLAAACGTRVEREEPLGAPARSVVGTDSTAPNDGGADTATAIGDPNGSQPGDRPEVAPAKATTPGSGARSEVSAGNQGTAAPTRANEGTKVTAPRGGGGEEGTGSVGRDGSGGDVVRSPGPMSGAGGTPTIKTPVKIGSVSTLSGPIGDTLGPLVKGAQVWVRWINDRGGLNGHPVQMKIWDDGGDPARHRSYVQEAVEKFGVVAFLSETAPTASEPSVAYIESKRIPVIGGDQGSQWPDRSPMYFIPAAYGKGIIHVGVSSIARRAAVLGLKKFGTITCSEVAECATNERYWHKYAVEQGLASVYKGKSSLVQPDFTAECLAARNAGVEVLAFSMDANSITRIAASCARQNYRPVYSSLGPLMVERLAKDPNLDGMILGSGVFPYVWKTHRAAADFLEAMKKYSPGRPAGPSEAAGWVAGKTLERATAALPEPPTSAAILEGLWRIKGDTLDGITGPITFTEGQPTSQSPTCGFDMLIRQGAWVSPDGFQLHCGSPS